MSGVEILYEFMREYFLPPGVVLSHSGWQSFSGNCCIHNGQTRKDTRKRAGIRYDGQRLTYHCFNCGMSTSYASGRYLPKKMIDLFRWSNIDDTDIKKLSFRLYTVDQPETKTIIKTSNDTIHFDRKPLPMGAKPLSHWLSTDEDNADFLDVLQYVVSRGNFYLEFLDLLHWTPINNKGISRRVIIPFHWNNTIVGWTARSIDNVSHHRYVSEQQSDFIFNNHLLHDQRKQTVYVVEGPLDAIAIGAVSVLGSSISTKQETWIKRSAKKIVVIPDRDTKGKAFAEYAANRGWAVSFPWANGLWDDDVKDVSEACLRYGRIFTMRTVLNEVAYDQIAISTKSKLLF